ncbi:MAG: hypothetical protein R2849_19050 [Thermomicrobiales bacterium]
MFTYRGEYLDRWGNDYRTSFGRPAGIVENSDGYIYVADELHGQVKIISYDGEFDGIIKHEFDWPVDVTFPTTTSTCWMPDTGRYWSSMLRANTSAVGGTCC